MRLRVVSRGLVLCLGLLLVACGDPLSDVPRYSEVPVSDAAGQADALPGGPAREPVTKDRPRRGLLGLFGARAERAKAAAPDTPDPEQPKTEVAVAVPAQDQRGGGGLFSGLFAGGGASGDRGGAPRSGAPDAREVSFGMRLPYGELARVCDVPRGKLGKKIEGYPARGSKYVLYDSAPSSKGTRSFYLTGFRDNCARQFTAALVVFGSPESYEQIHYGPSGADLPIAESDRAYETLKRRVCGARRGKPCGSRMRRLARDTVFVSVYERFGSNPRWKNILLHDGEVVAMDIKD